MVRQCRAGQRQHQRPNQRAPENGPTPPAAGQAVAQWLTAPTRLGTWAGLVPPPSPPIKRTRHATPSTPKDARWEEGGADLPGGVGRGGRMDETERFPAADATANSIEWAPAAEALRH